MLKIQTLRGRVHSPQGAHSITGLLKALDPVKTTAWWNWDSDSGHFHSCLRHGTGVLRHLVSAL